jgi:hypothetical protein
MPVFISIVSLSRVRHSLLCALQSSLLPFDEAQRRGLESAEKFNTLSRGLLQKYSNQTSDV